MSLKFNVKWNWSVVIITIVTPVIIFIAEIIFIQQWIAGYHNLFSFLAMLMGIFVLLFPLTAPISICLNNECITLNKLCGKKIIHFDKILSIHPFNMSFCIRIFGSGGYGGYLGVYSNAKIGRFHACVGDLSQTFLIRLKNGKNYVFSSENRDLVIETVKNKFLKQ